MNNEMSLNPYAGSDNNGSGGINLPSSAAGSAESTRAMAETQSAMVIAQKFPRNPQRAVDNILLECSRVGLADKATYQFSRGGTDIYGPSIRMAETIARHWGNFQSGLIELSRNNGVSEVMAFACDLQTNTWERIVFQVKHWRDTKQGGYLLKDERDIYELIANQGARRRRACILSLIPGDIVESALKQCDLTLSTKVQVTPETIRSMLDKFESFNVTKQMIEKRIQRNIDAITPGIMIGLGKIFTSLSDGMSVISDWFEIETSAATTLTGGGAQAGQADSKPAATKENKPATDRKAKPATDRVTDQPVETKQETDQPATGDLLGDQGGSTSGPFTVIDVFASIDKAETLDDLDAAEDLANTLPADDRATCAKRIGDKRRKLERG
jgi:hypothetical protein